MPISLEQRFGAHIRALRKARGYTQEMLAERSELSVDAVRRIERGAFSPSLGTIGKLSVGLNTSLRTLFEGLAQPNRAHANELCDFLRTRKPAEIRLADRVLRAIFQGR